MKEAIVLVTIAALVIVVIEDFRRRMISWYLIPLLLALFILRSVHDITIHETLFNFVMNAAFTTMQLLLLSLYFSIKEKKFVNIIDSWLGLGDVLLLYVLGAAFSPVNFLLFYIVSLVLTITGYTIYKTLLQGKDSTIPLAGAVALALILCLCYQLMVSPVSFYDDSPVLHLLR